MAPWIVLFAAQCAVLAETSAAGAAGKAQMPSLPLLLFGLFSQALYSLRIVVQMWESRKRGESYTPPSFWTVSLAAGILGALYYEIRSDPVNTLQQAAMLPIYIRNVYLIYKEQKAEQFNRRVWKWVARAAAAASFGLAAWALYGLLSAAPDINPQIFSVPFWRIELPVAPMLAFGFIGAAIFNGRFVVQWIATERVKKSVVPTSFWIMAAIGSFMLLLYNFTRHEPVGILSHSTTLPPFLYNLFLIRRSRHTAKRS